METHFISEDADQHQSNMEIIKNQIQTLDSEQLLSVLEDEEKNWGLQTKNNTRVSFELGYRKFFRPDEINLKTGKPFTVNLSKSLTNSLSTRNAKVDMFVYCFLYFFINLPPKV